ncbi:MAG: ROK family protein [Acidilobaceae archaeon]
MDSSLRVLAVDVGASKLRIAIFHGLDLVYRIIIDTPRNGGPYAVANAIIRYARDYRFDVASIASIGPLDLVRGWVTGTPNNPLRDFALRDPIYKSFNVPVYIANDCVASVWGEYILGNGRGLNDIVYVTISTGIGVGAIVDGHLLVGRRGNSHEAGHIVLDLNSSLKCGCGGLGHWEALAGGSNISKLAKLKALESTYTSKGREIALSGGMSSEILYRLAREGDVFALNLVDYLNRVHAAGLASLIAVYDPEAIFIGGSIYIYNEDLIAPGIMKYIREYSLLEPPPIRRATFDQDSGLYGALAIALKTPQEIARYTRYSEGDD